MFSLHFLTKEREIMNIENIESKLKSGNVVVLKCGKVGVIVNPNNVEFDTNALEYAVSYFSNGREDFVGWDMLNFEKIVEIVRIFAMHPSIAGSLNHGRWDLAEKEGRAICIFSLDRTITIDGNDIKISEESYQALRKSLT